MTITIQLLYFTVSLINGNFAVFTQMVKIILPEL